MIDISQLEYKPGALSAGPAAQYLGIKLRTFNYRINAGYAPEPNAKIKLRLGFDGYKEFHAWTIDSLDRYKLSMKPVSREIHHKRHDKSIKKQKEDELKRKIKVSNKSLMSSFISGDFIPGHKESVKRKISSIKHKPKTVNVRINGNGGW